MKKFIFLIIFTMLACASGIKTNSISAKTAPEYTGIDKRVRPLVNKFIDLSTRYNIVFKEKVTIGFKKINRENVIGLCTYGKNFREIDLDIEYWERASQTSRMTLIFHELSHCMCNRSHDYGKDLEYPNDWLDSILGFVQPKIKMGFLDGYLNDGCPMSIMHPTILSNSCMNKHKEFYLKETFDRCEPY